MLDGNSAALNTYLDQQDYLEQQWGLTMKDKQEAVVDLAIKLIKQETAPELFNWVFCDYLDTDNDEAFYNDLQAILYGLDTKYYHKNEIISDSLEGACMSLYDCELDEITFHAQPNLLKQVLEGLK
jgi:hypothetical protein